MLKRPPQYAPRPIEIAPSIPSDPVELFTYLIDKRGNQQWSAAANAHAALGELGLSVMFTETTGGPRDYERRRTDAIAGFARWLRTDAEGDARLKQHLESLGFVVARVDPYIRGDQIDYRKRDAEKMSPKPLWAPAHATTIHGTPLSKAPRRFSR